MRAIVFAVVVAVSAASGVLPGFEGAPVASACSCPGCDVVRDAEVIVAGRILSWRRTDFVSPFGADSVYKPIELNVRVDRVFKGSAPDDIVVIDFASYTNLKDPNEPDAPDRIVWSGAGGACGAFDDDPDSKYIVIGFGGTPLHPWQSTRTRVLFIGDEPSGEQYDWAMARLASLGGPYPPAAGDSAAEADAPADDWMFLSAIGSGLLLITLVLLLIGPRDDRPRR